MFSGVQSTRFPTWINSALDYLIGMRTWSFRQARKAITLVANQEAYALGGATPVAVDFGGVIDMSLQLTAGGAAVPISGADPQTYDRLARHSRVPGVPSIWCLAASDPPTSAASLVRPGGQLELRCWPTPTAAAGQGQVLDMLYWRTVESLKPTSDTDHLIGPGAFGEAVKEYAVAIGMASIGNLPNAQMWLQLCKDRLGPLITQDEAIAPVRDANRITMASRPNLSGPTAGKISPDDIVLPLPGERAS